MRNFSKITGCILVLLASELLSAVQPGWVVLALNNIRRAVTAGKAAAETALILGKCEHALSETEIDKFAAIAKNKGGVKEVAKLMGDMKLPLKYGAEAGELILQDAFLRIAVKNGNISRELATDALKHLYGTPGLTGLFRKINSVSPAQVKGHLRELELAVTAKKKGFQVISLGQKFADGKKGGDTDLDLFLMRDGIKYAIESKAYAGMIPDSMARADAQSLTVFCKKIKKTVPVFCFEKEPSKFTQWYLDSKDIKYFCGSSEEIITKLDLISSTK